MRGGWRLGLASLCAGTLAAVTAVAGTGTLDDLDLRIGKALFQRAWVPAPSSTHADDGLGPLFDARSCAACHPGGQRARAVIESNGHIEGRGMILALGRPDGSGDPVYGRRLQIDAVPGLKPEGILAVKQVAQAGGRLARVPTPEDLGYGPLDPATGMSLRVSPDLRGRGLLEQVPEDALVALEAAQSRGPDAVHGRLRRVSLPDGSTVAGRFGWKAAQPSLSAQSSEAFFLDMGLSTPLHPEPWGDCTESQTACRAALHGRETEDGFEIPNSLLTRVVAFVASLPAPQSPTSARGALLFASTGCAACHQPVLPLAKGGEARMFTDLLLHDLGPGLADTLPEPGAAASEWRTAPLAGLSDALSRRTGLLHDGRANSVEEAVLWHGGQAERAVRRFQALPRREKEALLAYVGRL